MYAIFQARVIQKSDGEKLQKNQHETRKEVSVSLSILNIQF